jgi:hypothetical protein
MSTGKEVSGQASVLLLHARGVARDQKKMIEPPKLESVSQTDNNNVQQQTSPLL